MNMLKIELSASVLLTLAVSLLTMGVSFLKEELLTEGCICIAVGFGLMLATIILLEKGIIERLKH